MAQHSNWKCPQCGNPDISGDLIKCPKCGKKRNRWGYWDCRYCGTKGIRADHKECLNCGKARDRNVKFYLRDDLVEFVDEVSGESAVRIRRPNWICPYCMQQNDDSVNTCVYCNASREESTERYHDVAPPQPVTMPQTQQQYPKVKRKKKMSPAMWCCLIFLAGFVLLFVAAFISVKIDEAASKKVRQADSFTLEWQSAVCLEEYKTLYGSDWELPDGVRLTEEREEEYTYIDHYEQRSREVWVDDDDDYDYGGGWDDGGWDDGGWDDGGWDDGGGWEDYGDGQFGVFRVPAIAIGQQGPEIVPCYYKTEYYDEPVYKTEMRTKYYYEYEAWVDGRTIKAQGGSDTEPYYEAFSLGDNERERERTVSFYVNFNDYQNNRQHLLISEDVYNQLRNSGTLEYRRDIRESRSNPIFIIVTDGREYYCDDKNDVLTDDWYFGDSSEADEADPENAEDSEGTEDSN